MLETNKVSFDFPKQVKVNNSFLVSIFSFVLKYPDVIIERKCIKFPGGIELSFNNLSYITSCKIVASTDKLASACLHESRDEVDTQVACSPTSLST